MKDIVSSETRPQWGAAVPQTSRSTCLANRPSCIPKDVLFPSPRN
jgi:hypothetical protein